MSRKFQDFMRELDAEARGEGAAAVAEKEAFGAHFRVAGELLALRKARGLTQRQLAERTGIQQSEISRIEGAHANPTLGTVSAIARALGAELRLVTPKKRPTARVIARGRVASAARQRRRTL